MSGFEGLLTGHTLAERYRIEEVIGRGGFAAVYRATDERLGRSVAVKVIVAPVTDADARERLRARFHREARAVASLQHPNVVIVYDFGTDPTLGLDFLVMELLRGEDLAALLERGASLPLPLAMRILRDAAEGVAAGHRNGLVHRDVKPGNIFLAEREGGGGFRVCVLDFGIAKVAAGEETLTHLTRAGEGFLSPAYASPEQVRGEKNLSPASDVFSLGVIGYELLAGARLFTRDRLADGASDVAPPLREANPGVPPEWAVVVERALAPDPAARWADAGQFAAALHEAAEPASAPDVARPLPPPAPSAAPRVARSDPAAATVRHRETAVDSSPPPVRGGALPPRRTFSGRSAAAILLLLVSAALALWWVTGRERGGGQLALEPAPAGPTAGAAAPRAAVPPDPVPGGPISAARDSALPPADELGAAAAVPAKPPPAREETSFPAASATATPAPTARGTAGAVALNRRGEQLFAAGDFEGAAEVFRRASEAAPANAYYRNNLGWALFQLGDTEEAGQVLEETIRLDPSRDIAHANLGEVHLARGDTGAAIAAYERFLELNTDPRRERIARDKLRRIAGGPHP